MIRILQEWDNANKRITKTYPFSIWLLGLCVVVGETHNDLMVQFSKYLNDSFGNDKWLIEVKNGIYEVHSRNKKHHYANFVYKDRNEASDKIQNVDQAEAH